MDVIQYFTEVDDCIMAAYKHVTKTGCKVSHYGQFDDNLTQFSTGLQTDDGYLFVMLLKDHVYSQRRNLARRIHKLKMTVSDFVNRQLIAFL